MPKKKSNENSEILNFETISAQLELIVAKLEDSDALSLEESLEAFEKGVQLTRQAQKILSESEQKVQMLIEKDGGLASEDYEPDTDR